MQRLGVFGKFWEPGKVKTRLAGSIGARAASRVYRMFLETTLRRFDAEADERWLAYWPPTRTSDFEAIGRGKWRLTSQHPGSLGDRIRCFLEQTLRDPEDATVVIGSDSPTLPRTLIQEAFEKLNAEHRVVLGPTPDGGYYLLGCRGRVPPIFSGINWSTGCVWEQTLELLRRAGQPFAELDPWYDVDELADLQRLHQDLEKMTRREPMDEQLRCVLQQVLAADRS